MTLLLRLCYFHYIADRNAHFIAFNAVSLFDKWCLHSSSCQKAHLRNINPRNLGSGGPPEANVHASTVVQPNFEPKIAIFEGKTKIIHVGRIRKNPGIHPGYHFYDFSLKNDNLGSKMKILKVLGI